MFEFYSSDDQVKLEILDSDRVDVWQLFTQTIGKSLIMGF